MQYVRLGKTGLKVSRICLGTMSFGNESSWTIEIDKARPIVMKALELGVNFFDTANVYSNGRAEEIVGELLKGRRNDVVIATKVHGSVGEGPNDEGLSRYHISREIEKSLKRLQTDHVDLYQTHRWSYDTPIEETLVALNDLVHAGKAAYIGGSSMYAWQFAKALFTSDLLGITRFVSMQNHYNLLYREEEREMLPLCKDQGIGIIPWSPLARGFLSGKYKRNETPTGERYKSEPANMFAKRFFHPEDFDILDVATEIAKEKGVKVPEVALAWLLHRGVTAPIIGATKIEHVEDAVRAVELKLTEDDMKRLEEKYKIHRILGHS